VVQALDLVCQQSSEVGGVEMNSEYSYIRLTFTRTNFRNMSNETHRQAWRKTWFSGANTQGYKDVTHAEPVDVNE
jgi:hypothetical protein